MSSPDPTLNVTTILLFLSTVLALWFAVDSVLAARELRRELKQEHDGRLVDLETGLLSRSAFLARGRSEVSRARRIERTLYVSVLIAIERPELVGANLADQLEFPQIGFRLGETTFSVITTESTVKEAQRDLGRLLAGATKHAGAVLLGTATFPTAGQEIEDILDVAATRALSGDATEMPAGG